MTQSEHQHVSGGTTDASVRLEVPARSAYVAIIRTVVGNLAARHDFTVEQIDDLRMSVDEAASLLLESATGPLLADFSLGDRRVDTCLSASTPAGHDIDRDSFGWTLLAALVDDVEARVSDEGDHTRTTIEIRAHADTGDTTELS